MGATKEKPQIIPRKSKDGSISSITYEFPYMLQPEKKTLRQLIYSSKSGKVFGRTPKNWGKVCSNSTDQYVYDKNLITFTFTLTTRPILRCPMIIMFELQINISRRANV